MTSNHFTNMYITINRSTLLKISPLSITNQSVTQSTNWSRFSLVHLEPDQIKVVKKLSSILSTRITRQKKHIFIQRSKIYPRQPGSQNHGSCAWSWLPWHQKDDYRRSRILKRLILMGLIKSFIMIYLYSDFFRSLLASYSGFTYKKNTRAE